MIDNLILININMITHSIVKLSNHFKLVEFLSSIIYIIFIHYFDLVKLAVILNFSNILYRKTLKVQFNDFYREDSFIIVLCTKHKYSINDMSAYN